MANHRNVARRLWTLTLTIGLLLWLAACTNGGSAPVGNPPAGKTPAFQLNIDTTVLSTGRLAARLTVNDAAELYQLSCRVAYDPAVLRPVDSRQAALITESATFFTTLQADGYVPVAFTYHDGTPLPSATGVLAELEFEVIDALADPQLRLLADHDYLIARDSTGADLEIGLGVAQ